MTLDSESFRRAMRAWTTGVAVILAAHDDESYGMTINSFTSLSLDPPLVTVVLKNDTRIFELITKSHAFGVTILSSEQQELAEDFAGRLHGAERMASITTRTLTSGASILTEGLAWMDCRVVHTYAAGVNTLFVAEVLEAQVRSTDNPLLYHDRAYHQLASGGTHVRPTDS
ncbi:MAG: flavin reductase [Anaerolineaceae bacterium]|nr:MAG: flavin reductase [Anaerolineaceae bacterium]